MSEQSRPDWEQRLDAVSAAFDYPPTPDVSAEVGRRLAGRRETAVSPRRLAWVVLAMLLLAGSLLAVPVVRAAVYDWLQIGAIRIFLTEPSTGQIAADPSPPSSETAEEPGRSLLDLAGATTWDQAQAGAGFPIRRPTYPPDLGPPDQVYLQTMGDPNLEPPVVILVWQVPERPEEVALALYQIAQPSYALKEAAIDAVSRTAVNGETAYWVRAPHQLRLESDEVEARTFVAGNVLIWAEDGLTYRLEGAPTMEEAVKIAESLR